MVWQFSFKQSCGCHTCHFHALENRKVTTNEKEEKSSKTFVHLPAEQQALLLLFLNVVELWYCSVCWRREKSQIVLGNNSMFSSVFWPEATKATILSVTCIIQVFQSVQNSPQTEGCLIMRTNIMHVVLQWFGKILHCFLSECLQTVGEVVL